MCGITGIIDFTKSSNNHQLLAMQSVLEHRGPDAKGSKWLALESCQIGLAHTRLSILDLSNFGRQPMNYKRWTITLNGEIYNFKEIREELIKKGHQFNSESDTEVVIHAFAEWETNCVNRFIGMFAFAIYDSHKNKLFLCRDRVGVKPLFVYWHDELLLFGSELKSFHEHPRFNKKINHNAVFDFLKNGFIKGPQSIFEHVEKVKPAHWLIVDIDKKNIQTKKYWSLEEKYIHKPSAISYQDAKKELESLLISACKYRMVSDVPVGVFLSGGFDSTLVTSLLQKESSAKIKTFTIGFPDGIDESPYAQKIAQYLGTNHTSYNCYTQDARDIIPTLSYYFDEPNADISCIPTVLVSKIAKKNVSVALSADGGDELFAGYAGFKSVVEQLEFIRKIPAKRLAAFAANAVNSFLPSSNFSLKRKLNVVSSVITSHPKKQMKSLINATKGLPDAFVDSFMSKEINGKINPNTCQSDFFDERNYLFVSSIKESLIDQLLVKVDRATMSVGLEGREPLLDHRLIEYSAKLPYEYKHDGAISKKILKDIVYDYVPAKLMDRPKIGFDLPLNDWLNDDLYFLIDEFLSEDKLKKNIFFNPPVVIQMVTDFRNGKLHYKDIIWRLISFQMWYKRWIEKE